MDYQWCHGPFCHQRRTTNRVRGVKGSKVLRTIKIKQDRVSIWNYFCDQTCMHDFIVKHIDEFARLHPRTECLETPIEIETINHPEQTHKWGWVQKAWTEKKIKQITS